MTRYLKTLGLALVAMLALSALAASAASAGKITLSGYPAVISGTQTGEANKLVLEASRTTECKEIIYSGEYKESEVAEEMAEATPEYKNCTSKILGVETPTTVTVNGCKLTLSVQTVTDATNATGQAHVRCPAGKKIEVHVWKTAGEHTSNATAFCTYTIGEQTVDKKDSVKYTVDAAHKSLTISGANLGLIVERTGGSLLNCGAASQNGTITAQATVTAKKAGVEQTITFS